MEKKLMTSRADPIVGVYVAEIDGKKNRGNVASTSPEELIGFCRAAVLAEADALSDFADRINADFVAALKILHDSASPLIVAGIGKSGHIARKIASTFSSIGKPAIFVHPAEASHGDLGVIQKDSAVLILSNSGETSELSDLIYYCKTHKIKTVALTASADSTLARNATATIAYGSVKEVCPNGLAPTTSTTLSLAIGDALSVGLVHMLGTAPEDFRRYHPGGELGARLLLVEDIMHRGDALPIVAPATPMAEVVVVMSEKSFGVAIVVDDGRLCGIITDGDMRRNVSRLWHCKAGDIATINPVLVEHDITVGDAVQLMTKNGITVCLVGDRDGGVAGLLHIHDCLKAAVTS
ncbi:MAG: KpsF/GutQ family sugar-phosphate isomerase [Sphingomonadales bacterium]|nr:MAG: KpsF/GutQ family sugar-phosphate isomerase [Sphingomonadales bacterium]